jgi:hypothetical protein
VVEVSRLRLSPAVLHPVVQVRDQRRVVRRLLALAEVAVDPDDAWNCPLPKDAAAQVKDRVAFWRGVRVEDR